MKGPKDILVISSKKLCLEAVKEASQSSKFLDELVDLSLKDEKPYSHRAGWTLVYLTEKHPNLIRPYLRHIASNLQNIHTHTQVASFLRLFDMLKYDHGEFGDVLDFCIHTIRMPVKAEYVKVIALNIMLQFGKIYPELAPELIEQIELSQAQFEMNHCKKKAKMVIKTLKNFQNHTS